MHSSLTTLVEHQRICEVRCFPCGSGWSEKWVGARLQFHGEIVGAMCPACLSASPRSVAAGLVNSSLRNLTLRLDTGRLVQELRRAREAGRALREAARETRPHRGSPNSNDATLMRRAAQFVNDLATGLSELTHWQASLDDLMASERSWASRFVPALSDAELRRMVDSRYPALRRSAAAAAQ